MPQTVPVSGIVNINGKPASSAFVTFIPREGTKGIECSGLTDESGRYLLKHPRGLKGVPPGDYSVAISRLVDGKGNAIELAPNVAPIDMGAAESLPPRYSSLSETQLKTTVPDTGGELNFDLKVK